MRHSNRKLFVLAAVMLLGSLLLDFNLSAVASPQQPFNSIAGPNQPPADPQCSAPLGGANRQPNINPVTFAPPVVYTATYGYGAATGDFNADGKDDIATTSLDDNSVGVRLNNGNGSFGPVQTLTVGGNPRDVVVADLNGDGNPDIAVADQGGSVSVLLGDGHGGFDAAVNYSIHWEAMELAVADFNNDGEVDLVTANLFGSGISVLMGNGDGSFAPHTDYLPNTGAGGVAVGDFNQDGFTDIVAGGLYILYNDGRGGFNSPINLAVSGVSPVVGDFNNDGRPDIAALNGQQAVVLLNDGNGTFSAHDYPLSNYGEYMTLADVNGDSVPDLLMSVRYNVSQVAVMLGIGDGTFGNPGYYTTAFCPHHLAAGHFNTDSLLDVVTAGGDVTGGGVGVLLNTSVVPSPTPTVTGTPPTITPTNTRVPTYTATPTPVPPTSTPTYVPLCSFTSRAYLTDTLATSEIAVGDFNRDGNQDVAVNGISPTLTLLNGNGDGSFSGPGYYQMPERAGGLIAADLNHDKAADLVAGTSSGSLLIMLSNGDGTFQPTQSYTISTLPLNQSVIADFNHDGNSDIIVPDGYYSGGSHSLYFVPGNGDGSFGAATVLSQTNSYSLIFSADLNADGNPDLILTEGDSMVYVMLGNGNGTFQPAVAYTGDAEVGEATIADFNNDGKPDLAIESDGTRRISVLLGNGDGSFQPPIHYPAQTTFIGNLAAADFNGDGNMDLAVAASGRLWLLYGDGHGSFTYNYLYHNQTFSTYLVRADFNNDNSPDLASVSNSSTPGVEVFINQCAIASTPTPSGTPPTATPTRTPQPTVCPNPFVDINGNVFFHAINTLYCQGVINGTDATHYSPAGTATRGQFAKIVVLALSVPLTTPVGGQSFTDVPPSYFAYQYIESGYAAGILSGFDAQSCTSVNAQYPCYLPGAHITRGQLTKLVVNAAHFALMTPTSGPSFSDVPPSNIFYAYIETAYTHHVVNGYLDGTFRPNNVIRRDEMAQIVYTAQLAYGTPTPRPTDTPVATDTSTPAPITPTDTLTPTPMLTDTLTVTLTPTPELTDTPTVTLTPTP